jgi:hypothetical protein
MNSQNIQKSAEIQTGWPQKHQRISTWEMFSVTEGVICSRKRAEATVCFYSVPELQYFKVLVFIPFCTFIRCSFRNVLWRNSYYILLLFTLFWWKRKDTNKTIWQHLLLPISVCVTHMVALREYLRRYQDRWKVNRHVTERQSEGNWRLHVASMRWPLHNEELSDAAHDNPLTSTVG